MQAVTKPPDTPDPSRRLLLLGLVSAYTASLIPWALAEEATDAENGAFLAVSAILVGRPSLDSAQAQRLYAALVADDSGFGAAAKSLLDTIEQRKIDPMQLQKVLDDEKSPLAGRENGRTSCHARKQDFTRRIDIPLTFAQRSHRRRMSPRLCPMSTALPPASGARAASWHEFRMSIRKNLTRLSTASF